VRLQERERKIRDDLNSREWKGNEWEEVSKCGLIEALKRIKEIYYGQKRNT